MTRFRSLIVLAYIFCIVLPSTPVITLKKSTCYLLSEITKAVSSLAPHQTSKTKASAALGTKRHKEGKNPIIVILLAFNVKVI